MKTFLISDLHWNHRNILTFLKADGSPLRPFSSVEEMTETMVDNWNRIVGKNDKVYDLGDVCMGGAKQMEVLSRLNGDKVLIKGNHDNNKISAYLRFYRDVRAYHTLDKILLAHIPIHPGSLIPRWRGQIHGHTHSNRVFTNTVLDKNYICVSVEQTGFSPVDFEMLRCQFPPAKNRDEYACAS